MAELQTDDPRFIGSYALLERVGTGGMGRVYLAHSPGGMRVAVKVIHPHLAEDEEFRARFRREVIAARRVNGAFTALVVAADVDGPVPWVATAYVPGPSLFAVVSRGGPLSLPVLAALAAGLAEGLNAIHEAGVIHRDLTPSNVLLSPDGPRIIDFGISASAGATALTRVGQTFGTPAFMSPEQANALPMGPASDIFSLAAVLTFAARGTGPFGTGEAAVVLLRAAFGHPDIAGVPSGMAMLLSRCLSADPDLRPTAREFLTEVTAGFPQASRPIDWGALSGELPEAPVRCTGPRAPQPPLPLAVASPGIGVPAPVPARSDPAIRNSATRNGRIRPVRLIELASAAVLAAGVVITLAASGAIFGRPLSPPGARSSSTARPPASLAPSATAHPSRMTQATATPAYPRTVVVTVPVAAQWVDTRVTVPAGNRLTITATGIAILGSGTGTGAPDGGQSCGWADQPWELPFLAPSLTCWSLVGKIGPDGAPFEIGAGTTLTTRTAGRLYLAANDSVYADNSGSWTATIREG
jgi:hypothetical protein